MNIQVRINFIGMEHLEIEERSLTLNKNVDTRLFFPLSRLIHKLEKDVRLDVNSECGGGVSCSLEIMYSNVVAIRAISLPSPFYLIIISHQGRWFQWAHSILRYVGNDKVDQPFCCKLWRNQYY